MKTNDILSSLTKSLDNSFKWAGGNPAAVKNWDKGQPNGEKCGAMSNNKMKSVKCEVQSNFMCESHTKPRYFLSLLKFHRDKLGLNLKHSTWFSNSTTRQW